MDDPKTGEVARELMEGDGLLGEARRGRGRWGTITEIGKEFREGILPENKMTRISFQSKVLTGYVPTEETSLAQDQSFEDVEYFRDTRESINGIPSNFTLLFFIRLIRSNNTQSALKNGSFRSDNSKDDTVYPTLSEPLFKLFLECVGSDDEFRMRRRRRRGGEEIWEWRVTRRWGGWSCQHGREVTGKGHLEVFLEES